MNNKAYMHDLNTDKISKSECLICSQESFFIKQANDFSIFKCSACGIEYTYPMPSKQKLEEFYSEYFDLRAVDEVVTRNASRNLKFIQSKHEILQGGVLDYGCGKNAFINACRQEGFMNSYGYDQYVDCKNDNFRITDKYQNKKWDIIAMWGVLEHLTAPISQLVGLKNILSEDGIIALTTVHIEGFIPYQHKPPEHTLYFTRESLYKICKLAGLTILGYHDYYMEQKSDIYLSILHRTMPDKYQKLISNNMPEFIEIPTNEVFLILGKNKENYQ